MDISKYNTDIICKNCMMSTLNFIRKPITSEEDTNLPSWSWGYVCPICNHNDTDNKWPEILKKHIFVIKNQIEWR